MLLTADNFLVRPYRILNLDEAKDFPQWLKNTERELMISVFGKEQAEMIWEYGDQSQTDEMMDALIEKLSAALVAGAFSEWIIVNNYKLTTIGYIEQTQQNTTVLASEEFVVLAWNDYVKKLCAIQKEFTELNMTIPPFKNRYSL